MLSKTAWTSSDLLLGNNDIRANTLIISKSNDVYMKVDAEPVIRQELSDYFTFMVPGAKFMPAYKNRMWDGKIRLYDARSKELYLGLLSYVKHFAEERDYEIDVEDDLDVSENLSLDDAKQFITSLKTTFTPRDYQLDSFVHLVRNNRGLLVSPTASQSIYKQRKDYFAEYDVVIGDECHLFKAKSLTSIMTKLIDCKYRFGFTGTLDGTQTHKLVLEGLFGKVKQFVKTKELIDQDHLANFKIKALVLKYTDEEKKLVSKMKYKDEMDFIVTHDRRNNFIKKLTISLQGNTLLLFQYVEKQGKVLYDIISKSAEKNRKVFFVYGGTDAETREQIRAITENERDAIIIASFGTFSTGINIRNLHNIIFASPTKSRIRNLQSIGRGLRKGDAKEKATLFDVSDDLRWKSKVNYTLKHFSERIKTYSEEEFEYKIHNIKI
jgi:superfamily II DNA or RNA helicase